MMDSHPKHADPRHNICGQQNNPPGASCTATGGPKNLDDCFKYMWETWLQVNPQAFSNQETELLKCNSVDSCFYFFYIFPVCPDLCVMVWFFFFFNHIFLGSNTCCVWRTNLKPKDVWRAESKWLEKKLESSTADWQIAPLQKQIALIELGQVRSVTIKDNGQAEKYVVVQRIILTLGLRWPPISSAGIRQVLIPHL